MNKSYNKIPKILENKTILFTGIYPGVGKSYTLSYLYNQLIEKGFRVYKHGTTQKASSNIDSTTVASRDFNREGNDFFIKPGICSRTNGFYLIDEAFMYSQREINDVKARYPYMCFILFGDPMQFEPVSGEDPITSFDLNIRLEKMMRCDNEIVEALETLKSGYIPFDFLWRHSSNQDYSNIPKDALFITYTKDDAKFWSNFVYDFNTKHDSMIQNMLYVSTKRVCHKNEFGDKTISELQSVSNNENWRLTDINVEDQKVTLERISGDKKVCTFTFEEFNIHFRLGNGVNTHKCQGDTIRPDASDIIVATKGYNPKHNQTFLRHLYVAISRAQKSSQVHFFYEDVKDLQDRFVFSGPMTDYLSSASQALAEVSSTSSEICTKDILNEIFLPIISGHNVTLIPAHGMDKLSHLVQGKPEEDRYMARNRVDIIYDRHLSDRLQSELDKRPLQNISGKGDGKVFITANKTSSGLNTKEDVEEYNWFVFEIDRIDEHEVTAEEIEYAFLKRKSGNNPIKYPEAKNHSFRVIYSGAKSYHFWIYVDNEELNTFHSRELYKAVHNYLNDLLFNGWADRHGSTPEHYFRAPNVMRCSTGKIQELYKFKGKKTIHIDNILSLLPENKTETPVAAPVDVTASERLVEQAFTTYKDDIPTTNGGRGQTILSKLMKEYMRGFLSKEQIEELCTMLCTYANCPEKIHHLKSYIKEW